MRMKDSTERLVQFIKLVYLSGSPAVPQDAVRQHQLVRGVEGGPVPAVGVRGGGLHEPGLLAGGDVIDGGHSFSLGPYQLVLEVGRKLEVLLRGKPI